MDFTLPIVPIELWILAVVVIALMAIKVLCLLIKPKAWAELASKIYAKPVLTAVICFILALIVLQNLLANGITYTQIFAVTLFISLLMWVTLSVYSKEMSELAKKLLRDKKFWKKAWSPTLIWVLLAFMALKEIFYF